MSGNNLINWRMVPLVRPVIALLAGVAVAYYGDVVGWTWGAAGVLLISLLLNGYLIWRPPLSNPWLGGIGVLLLFFIVGYLRTSTVHPAAQQDFFAVQPFFSTDTELKFAGQITSITPAGERMRATMKLLYLRQSADNEAISRVSGNVLVYLPADSVAVALHPGCRLLMEAKINAIQPALNPDAFDFAAWQARSYTYHSAYVEKGNWQQLDARNTINSYAWHARKHLLGILRQYLPPASDQLGVASAIILGYTAELSQDIRAAYTQTGAVHVLAVSGLHVGFIAWGLGLLLGGARWRKGWLAWVRLIVLLAGLWGFALVTGLSPSVQRAAAMFSMVVLGQTFMRQSNIYNVLAAAALVLVFVDPMSLWNIGFQLSFLAVLGIVFFEARIRKWWFPPEPVTRYAWNMTTVGVAAQLTTLPSTLYYFHQFPVYFWLSGLVVVTAASFILGLGILLLLAAPIWSLLASGIGWLLNAILWMTNTFLTWVQALPGALITDWWLEFPALLLFCAAVITVAIAWAGARPVYWVLALGLLFLTVLVQTCYGLHYQQQYHLAIYHQRRASSMDIFYGKTAYSMSTLEKGDEAWRYSADNYRSHRGITSVVSLDEPDSNCPCAYEAPFLACGSYLILLLEPGSKIPANTNQTEVDMVWVRNKPWLQLEAWSKAVKATVWIFDGSNPTRWVEDRLEEADALGITTHWTAQDGAFITQQLAP